MFANFQKYGKDDEAQKKDHYVDCLLEQSALLTFVDYNVTIIPPYLLDGNTSGQGENVKYYHLFSWLRHIIYSF